jgi:hypothetical protein
MKVLNKATLLAFGFICFGVHATQFEFNPKALGGWAISADCFNFICNHVELGRPILEMGSGSGTGELARYFTMYSVEHNSDWLDKYTAQYIYAPIKQYSGYKWFDVEILKAELPREYDLILVDGPPGTIGREGFLHNIHLFNTDAIIIFDDIQRAAEMNLLKAAAVKLNRPYNIVRCSDGKSFGVIYPQ